MLRIPLLTSMKSLRFVKKGTLSILDQGLFSGTSFIVSLLLGRWLIPADYGAYALAMTVFLFTSGLFSSILLEPMSIFGPSRYKENHEDYHGSLFIMFLGVTLILMIIVIGVARIWFYDDIRVFLVLAISTPSVLLFWLIRWNGYTQVNPFSALTTTFTYTICVFIGILLVKNFFSISATAIFIIFGIAGLITSLIFLRSTKIRVNKDILFHDINVHSSYGKWLVMVSVLSWFSFQVYLVFVGKYLNLEEAAAFRAIQNFSQPLEQISTALGLLIVPWVTRKNSEGGFDLKKLNLINIFLMVIDVLYIGILIIGKDYLINSVYAGQYDNYSWLLLYFLFVPVVLSLSRGAQIGSRVVQKPQMLLLAYGISTFVTMVFGPWFIQEYGLQGAVFGRILSVAVFSLSINVAFFIHLRQSPFVKKEHLPATTIETR